MLPLMFGQSALLPSPPSCRLYTQTRPLISLHIYALYQKQAGLSKAQHGPHTIWHSIVKPPIGVLWFGGLSMRSSTMRHLQVVPRRYPAVSIAWQIPTPHRTACMHLTHGAQEGARALLTQSNHGWGEQHLARQVRRHGPQASTSVDSSTPRVAHAASSPYADMHTCASSAGAHTLSLSVVLVRGGVARGPPVRHLHRRRRCRVSCQSASNRH